MKKHSFFSLMYKDGRKQAVKHEGYTDGTYNYYKSDFKSAWWHAIEPSTGLSVAADSTRKTAAEQAHKLTEKVKERLQAMPGAVAEFTKYRAEAKEANA